MKIEKRNKFLIVIAVLLLVSASSSAQSLFNEHFNFVREVPFTEADQPVILSDKLFIQNDSEKQLIVTDFGQSRIFIFDMDGTYISSFGNRGRGPGEFEFLIKTKNFDRNRYLAAEFSGELSFYNKENQKFISEKKLPVTSLSDMHKLDNDTLLLIGRGFDKGANFLNHIYDIKSNKVTKSFFKRPPVGAHAGILNSIGFLGISSVNRSISKIASFVAAYDTLYVHDIHGNLINKIHVKFKNFKSVNSVDITKPAASIDEAKIYFRRFSRIDKIFWVENQILLQYYNTPDNVNYTYYLSLINTEGEVVFEIENTPVLHTYMPDEKFFLFQRHDGTFFFSEMIY